MTAGRKMGGSAGKARRGVFAVSSTTFRVSRNSDGVRTCAVRRASFFMFDNRDDAVAKAREEMLVEAEWLGSGKGWDDFVAEGRVVEKGNPLPEGTDCCFVHSASRALGVERWHGCCATERTPFYFREIIVFEIRVGGEGAGQEDFVFLCGKEDDDEDAAANQRLIERMSSGGDTLLVDDGQPEISEQETMMRILGEWSKNDTQR